MSRSTCPNCGGSGTDTITLTDMCHTCHGTGFRTCSWKGFFDRIIFAACSLLELGLTVYLIVTGSKAWIVAALVFVIVIGMWLYYEYMGRTSNID